ncbi:gp12 [Listeria phage P35]|uniref:Uncharacterized protein n=1 Tax=Listeria phage LP-083-1 TaxID=1458854 RepID=A0A059T6N2_9CAUD|nr:gp12 [Listeria phage P35]AAY53197.1 gp12 [Listeria phage P35]AHL18977.1 hypothetical protein LP083-1_012 [Listeria phage LP-083-1]
MPKTFTVRPLKGDDIFTLANIVQKLDLANDLIEKYKKGIDEATDQSVHLIKTQDHKKKQDKRQDQLDKIISDLKAQAQNEKFSVEFMGLILQKVLTNISKVKPELNAFLSDVADCDVSELSMIDYGVLVKQVFTGKDFRDFFQFIPTILTAE